jgi:hypothetical protein
MVDGASQLLLALCSYRREAEIWGGKKKKKKKKAYLNNEEDSTTLNLPIWPLDGALYEGRRFGG